MNRSAAAVGSAVFFAVAPGTVAGLVPYLLTGWHAGPIWPPLRVAGALLVAAGGVVIVQAFVRFVMEGFGTPAPVAPPEHLVIGGLYRFVRNPMYVAVVTAVLGQALLLGQLALLWYALIAWALMAAFTHWYEEPALRAKFGDDYEAYHKAVPAWIPKIPSKP
ncbi:isoprenylcysteine carboxylmethyltransferase family protein [Streptosporangiaceae bacterium NEAU-GS5]|nr:isoprenylcysteine carboxylmethyltransferase family protein [Streptosporangiaceae bacterium NEAU-GS5]